MHIPFYRPHISDDEIAEVVDTLRSGWLTTGPKTKKFEKAFGEYVGQQHAVAVNSCTAALHLALEALGVKPGEGVVVPTMTFAATAEVVRYMGAKPILADCRLEDLNLNVDDAARRIDAARKEGVSVVGIIPVHYGGQAGDMKGVRALAEKYSLKVVEDAAHCCPAYYKDDGTTGGRDYGTMGPRDYGTMGRRDIGTMGRWDDGTAGPRDYETTGLRGEGTTGRGDHGTGGDSGGHTPHSTHHTRQWLPVGADADISCYSFYANKTITTGEGGMACTNHDGYADRMRMMSLHGISRDAWKRFTAEGSWYYEILAPGFKYNLTDIAAAIGIHQLKKADWLHQRRREIVAFYHHHLADVEELILPRELPDRIHSWHLFSVRLRIDGLRIDRAEFIKEMQQRGIGTSVHWMPLHMHPYYRETFGYRPEDLPTSAGLYPQLVTLPVYPGMAEEEVTYVCDGVREIVAGNLVGGK